MKPTIITNDQYIVELANTILDLDEIIAELLEKENAQND